MKDKVKQEIKENAVGFCSFEFDDTPTWNDVEGVSNWLNQMIKKGAMFFVPMSGDCFRIMAFKRKISSDAVKSLEDFDDFDFLEELEAE